MEQSVVGRFLFDHAVAVLALLVATTTLALFLYLNELQDQLVEALAEQGTRQQSETLEELRGLYTSDVVEKVRGHGVNVTHDYQGRDNAIPLPATLTIELGRRIGERGSGMNVRLFSDYPFPWRKDGGPRDAFEREALAALARDPEHAFSRVEQYGGQPVIRYAVADRMRVACVDCHNSHPASPKKDWKVGDVRGVLEVTRPISSFAAAARSGQRQAFVLLMAVAIVGLAGVAVVFGKQRLSARRLAEEIEERKKLERVKNEFVSIVSHELRTPLTSIMGSLGLIAGGASGEIPGQAKTLVDIARKNSERLLRLINDILDIEKIESGRMQFKLKPLELQPLLEHAAAANEAYAAQFGVSFASAARLPGARARVDADALMQVMTNLMSNAAKFSPARTAVELRLVRRGGMIRLSVTDHGPGIPQSFQAKVFEKFSQADASDSRQKGGTGLGLAISKAIVEKMGGGIGFSTVEGKGTTFHVDLPEWTEPVQ